MAKGRFHGIYPMLYTFFDQAGGLDRRAGSFRGGALVC